MNTLGIIAISLVIGTIVVVIVIVFFDIIDYLRGR